MRPRFLIAVTAFSILSAFHQARSCEKGGPGYRLFDLCTADLAGKYLNQGRFALRVKCHRTRVDGWDYNVRDTPPRFPPAGQAELLDREEEGVVVEEQECDAPLGNWDKDAGWRFDEFVENLRGPYYDLWGYGGMFGRTVDKKRAGDYLSPPGMCSGSPGRLTDKQMRWLNSILEENMEDDYYCPEMGTFCRAYDRVLLDSSRTEYYGTLEINHRKLAFGGWFEKLAVFGFFDPYDGVDEFIKKAKEYFNLPDITGDAVRIERKDDKYFYSVLDRDARYWLRGYRIVLSDIKTNERHPWDVIELLRFYDEEFVP